MPLWIKSGNPEKKMPDALVHLRVPAATKAAWVRESRAAGMRLTDWIVRAVEGARMEKITRFVIPDGMAFSDLSLARDPDGSVSFETGPLVRICEASGLDPDLMLDEDNRSRLIVGWYAEHLRNGGARDPVQDDLIAEMMAEDAAGQNFSLPPGCA